MILSYRNTLTGDQFYEQNDTEERFNSTKNMAINQSISLQPYLDIVARYEKHIQASGSIQATEGGDREWQIMQMLFDQEKNKALLTYDVVSPHIDKTLINDYCLSRTKILSYVCVHMKLVWVERKAPVSSKSYSAV